MKKLTVFLLILAFIFSFAGCSNVIYSYMTKTLYDENGNAVQLWFCDPINGGFAYEIMQDEDGSAYISINTSHDHETKVPLPTEDVLEMDEHKSFGAMKTFEDWGDCILSPTEGDNVYQGQRIAAVYYLDRNAHSPVIVMTDLLNGVAQSYLIEPTETIDGRFFVLSNGMGEYEMVSADGTADEILAALPDDATLVEMVNICILHLVRDSEGNLVKAEGRNISNGSFVPVEYDVFVDEEGNSHLVVPTVTGESIYVCFDPAPYESSGPIATPVMEYAATLPADIL